MSYPEIFSNIEFKKFESILCGPSMMDYPGTSGNLREPHHGRFSDFFIDNFFENKYKKQNNILLKNRSLTDNMVPHEIAVIGSDLKII